VWHEVAHVRRYQLLLFLREMVHRILEINGHMWMDGTIRYPTVHVDLFGRVGARWRSENRRSRLHVVRARQRKRAFNKEAGSPYAIGAHQGCCPIELNNPPQKMEQRPASRTGGRKGAALLVYLRPVLRHYKSRVLAYSVCLHGAQMAARVPAVAGEGEEACPAARAVARTAAGERAPSSRYPWPGPSSHCERGRDVRCPRYVYAAAVHPSSEATPPHATPSSPACIGHRRCHLCSSPSTLDASLCR
jgi:hypothetical protein